MSHSAAFVLMLLARPASSATLDPGWVPAIHAVLPSLSNGPQGSIVRELLKPAPQPAVGAKEKLAFDGREFEIQSLSASERRLQILGPVIERLQTENHFDLASFKKVQPDTQREHLEAAIDSHAAKVNAHIERIVKSAGGKPLPALRGKEANPAIGEVENLLIDSGRFMTESAKDQLLQLLPAYQALRHGEELARQITEAREDEEIVEEPVPEMLSREDFQALGRHVQYISKQFQDYVAADTSIPIWERNARKQNWTRALGLMDALKKPRQNAAKVAEFAELIRQGLSHYRAYILAELKNSKEGSRRRIAAKVLLRKVRRLLPEPLRHKLDDDELPSSPGEMGIAETPEPESLQAEPGNDETEAGFDLVKFQAEEIEWQGEEETSTLEPPQRDLSDDIKLALETLSSVSFKFVTCLRKDLFLERKEQSDILADWERIHDGLREAIGEPFAKRAELRELAAELKAELKRYAAYVEKDPSLSPEDRQGRKDEAASLETQLDRLWGNSR